MEMARLRAFGLRAVVGLAVGVSGCTSAPSSAQVADVHRQAQEALTRWDAAVAAGAGGSGFVLVGESTLFVGSDWGPNIDGGNAKLAMSAGLFVAANPLPSETPPDASVQWPDGTTHTVPVISAEQAVSDLKATGVSPCPDCTPLQITGGRLTTATFQSSRGPAQVPAWEFSLKDTDVKLDQIAVGGRIAPPPVADHVAQTSVGPAAQSATVDASGMTFTVTVVGAQDAADKPCGADYTAEAVESDNAIVVIVYEHRNTAPVACSLVGYPRTAQVTLAKPLVNRTLIDLQAQPISVTAAH
jgi:hypothetical protein